MRKFLNLLKWLFLGFLSLTIASAVFLYASHQSVEGNHELTAVCTLIAAAFFVLFLYCFIQTSDRLRTFWSGI